MHGMRIRSPGILSSTVLLWFLHHAPLVQAQLLKDIETQPEEQDSIVTFSNEMRSVGDQAIFTAASALHGSELWITDGTASGTHEIKELVPGDGGVFVLDSAYNCSGLYLAPMHGSVTGNPGTGLELLVSDGTAQGTLQLGDLSPGEASTALFAQPVAFSGSCYLMLTVDADGDGSYALELWKTDGSPAGTQAVKTLKPAAADGSFGFIDSKMIVHDGSLFFTTDDQDLWKSDGTTAGTVLVTTITTSNGSADLAEFVSMDDTLFFTADDDTNGRELWKSDGTAGGTVIVEDIFAGPDGSNPFSLTAHDGRLYFTAAETAGNSELWVSDGTSAGTHLVLEIVAGPTGGNLVPMYSTSTDLLFIWRDASFQNPALWRSDGTAAGTVQVGALVTEPGTLVGAMRLMNDELYFLYKHFDTNSGTLRKYDRVQDQIVDVADIGFPDFSPLVALESQSRLLFTANHPDAGFEPWISDGTQVGTHLLLNIYGETDDSSVGDFSALPNGTVIFDAENRNFGNEFYTTTGSPGSAELLADLVPGPNRSVESVGEVYRGALYYTGSGPGDPHDFELWRTDGTPAGTELVANINPAQDGVPEDYTLWNDILFFLADDGTSGEELWRLNDSGLPEMVRDINPGSDDSDPDDFVATSVGLVFVAEAPDEGLWLSDGTEAGTQVVISESDGVGDFEELLAFKDGVLLSAETAAEGNELWFSDGTSAGTALVADLMPGPDSSFPTEFVSLGDVALFVARTQTNGWELWVTGGTAGTTHLLKDILPGPASSEPNDFSVLGDRLFFSAHTPDSGQELWVSDGTSAGTRLLADLLPGPQSSFADPDAAGAGRVFFSANDDVHGVEVWATDGTPAGSVMIADVEPGPGSSSPRNFHVIDRRLYFVAGTSTYGLEPHVLDVNRAPEAVDLNLATDENSSLRGTLQATDSDGDVITYALAAGPGNGTVELDDTATGEFTYTPDPDFNGVDSFTFTASDDRAGSVPGLVEVTINNANVAPVADPLSVSGDENTVISGTLTASDADGDALAFAKAGDPANGTVTVEADGAFSYTPDTDYTGDDSFTFTASDGEATSAPATVSITVSAASGGGGGGDGDDDDDGDGNNNPPVDGSGDGGGSAGLWLLAGLSGLRLLRRRLSRSTCTGVATHRGRFWCQAASRSLSTLDGHSFIESYGTRVALHL